jgi:drug/metabolite transporter (DMT)-like permease
MSDAHPRKDHLDALAVSLLLACCMFWGLQQILVKLIIHEVAPLFQASLRCVGACVLLMLWCRLRGIRCGCRSHRSRNSTAPPPSAPSKARR